MTDNESCRISVPYTKFTYPPYYLNVPKMLTTVRAQLDDWIATIDPPFTQQDALHLENIEHQQKRLQLHYTIVRNKWVEPQT